ncbi:MAG: Rrf2 family transcriptional regulator [Coriobacteriia bacterium]|nr:Rrf2 family transcriptional regulator [Coriobacteriia bacterium]
MKISTKGTYAVRLMLLLAMRGDELVSLKEISRVTGISKKYLEQIVPSLTSAGLLRSVRGAQGGYRLANSPDKITILDVLNVMEGSIAPASCLQGEKFECNFPTPCMEFYVWKGLHEVQQNYLSSITLQDVLDHSSSAAIDNYCI